MDLFFRSSARAKRFHENDLIFMKINEQVTYIRTKTNWTWPNQSMSWRREALISFTPEGFEPFTFRILLAYHLQHYYTSRFSWELSLKKKYFTRLLNIPKKITSQFNYSFVESMFHAARKHALGPLWALCWNDPESRYPFDRCVLDSTTLWLFVCASGGVLCFFFTLHTLFTNK